MPTWLWAIVCTADVCHDRIQATRIRFKVLTVVIAMSVLTAIWDPTAAQAETAKVKGRGIKRKAEAEWKKTYRPPSPRRSEGVKSFLSAWAKGETSAVGVWRLVHSIATGTSAIAVMA